MLDQEKVPGNENQEIDKNEEILEFVRKNPLARESEIADKINLSLSATHNRIVKLKKMKRLRSGMTVDLNAIGFDHRYRIDIKINPRRLRQAVEAARKAVEEGKQLKDVKGTDAAELFNAVEHWHHLSNHQEILAFHILSISEKNPDLIVEDVAVLLGDPADLSATVRIRSPRRDKAQRDDPVVKLVYSFVTEELRGMTSIDNTETCIEAWSCSHEMQERLLEERPKRSRKTDKLNAKSH